MRARNQKRGFTLIELLIVVGIISLLVVVLFVAVFPWLGKSKVSATTSLLQQIGGTLSADKLSLNVNKFKKDAGSLSKDISNDEKTASSQMMMFYTAPTREVWDQSSLYKDRNYAPKLQPQEFTKFSRDDAGKLPYLVDAWETPIWYKYEKVFNGGVIYSAGEDTVPGNADDLIYDPRNDRVKLREELE